MVGRPPTSFPGPARLALLAGLWACGSNSDSRGSDSTTLSAADSENSGPGESESSDGVTPGESTGEIPDPWVEGTLPEGTNENHQLHVDADGHAIAPFYWPIGLGRQQRYILYDAERGSWAPHDLLIDESQSTKRTGSCRLSDGRILIVWDNDTDRPTSQVEFVEADIEQGTLSDVYRPFEHLYDSVESSSLHCSQDDFIWLRLSDGPNQSQWIRFAHGQTPSQADLLPIDVVQGRFMHEHIGGSNWMIWLEVEADEPRLLYRYDHRSRTIQSTPAEFRDIVGVTADGEVIAVWPTASSWLIDSLPAGASEFSTVQAIDGRFPAHFQIAKVFESGMGALAWLGAGVDAEYFVSLGSHGRWTEPIRIHEQVDFRPGSEHQLWQWQFVRDGGFAFVTGTTIEQSDAALHYIRVYPTGEIESRRMHSPPQFIQLTHMDVHESGAAMILVSDHFFARGPNR